MKKNDHQLASMQMQQEEVDEKTGLSEPSD
jgi:hypothetical protein